MVAVVAVVEGVGVGGVAPVGVVTHKRLVVEKAYQIVFGAEIIKTLLNRDMVEISMQCGPHIIQIRKSCN